MSSARTFQTSSERRIYTVGHSTRSFEELLGLLVSMHAELLIDVRSVPRSRRHPQFEKDNLAQALPANEIEYAHERALGGFRKPHPDSPNAGWERPAFRGYADHMATPEFAAALRALEVRASEQTACIMCAEAQWWRCHRRLIADALLARDWEVLHLGVRPQPVQHELTPFAVRDADGTLSYPPPQSTLPL
jgi:uncharacterized protein (DUF488 family)